MEEAEAENSTHLIMASKLKTCAEAEGRKEMPENTAPGRYARQ